MIRKIIYSRRSAVRSRIMCGSLLVPFVALLFFGDRALAQSSDRLGELRSKADAYTSRALQEKLFVQTDKPAYLAGEICWMKIWCVDGSSHRALDLSKVAYVELLDREDRFVLQGKIGLEDAEGKGSFFLPLTLASGNYKLRAYTAWMKNFGPDHFFEKTVTIINTLKELPASATVIGLPGAGGAGIAGPGGGGSAGGVGAAAAAGASGSAPAGVDAGPGEQANYSVAFFPEGGDLLRDIPSKVGFQVTDRFGKGVEASGWVVDEQKDTVAVFSPLHAGLGSFLFTPAGDHHYSAFLRLPGNDTLVKELPATHAQGYALRLEEGNNNGLRLTVHARGVSPEPIYLFGQCHSIPRLTMRSVLSGDSAVFVISKDSLGEGINQLTVFNAAGRPVCERLYFRRPGGRMSIDVKSDQPQYGLRQKVNLQVRPDGAGAAGARGAGSAEADSGRWYSSMSLSVYRIDSLQSTGGEDIYSYWWLGSELKGRIESPDFYLSASGPAADQATDNLMLTHGWRRFRWENILKDGKASFPYPPELSGQMVTGRLTDSHTGGPVANRLSFFSAPGTQFQFQAAKSDTAGRLFFDIKDYYGPGSIVVQTGTIGDSVCKVDILSPFSEQYTSDRLPPLALSVGQRQSLTDRHFGMQVQNIWTGDSLQKFRGPSLDTLRFFGRADFSYQLDDYTRFTTMEEVLREYVHEVNVNHLHGHLHVLMLNEPHHEFFGDENTLIMLDGVPVGDRIFGYDPLKIKKLDVVPRMYFQGPASFSGILSFTTYKGDYEGMELDPRSVLVDYEGLQWQREFYSPVYATDSLTASRLPDYRNLLFWSPDIHTFEKGKEECHFYTSDLPGKYQVVVQGLTADGRAGSATMRFEVKK